MTSHSALNLSYGVQHFATESHPGLRFARASTPQGKSGLLKTRAFLYLTMLCCHIHLFPRLVTFFWGSRQEVSSVLYSIVSIYLRLTLPYLDLAQRVKNQSINPISPRVGKRVRFSFLTIISASKHQEFLLSRNIFFIYMDVKRVDKCIWKLLSRPLSPL